MGRVKKKTVTLDNTDRRKSTFLCVWTHYRTEHLLFFQPVVFDAHALTYGSIVLFFPLQANKFAFYLFIHSFILLYPSDLAYCKQIILDVFLLTEIVVVYACLQSIKLLTTFYITYYLDIEMSIFINLQWGSIHYHLLMQQRTWNSNEQHFTAFINLG